MEAMVFFFLFFALSAVAGLELGRAHSQGEGEESDLGEKHRTICNVLDFGALGDGRTYDTAAIQAAIDRCSSTMLSVSSSPSFSLSSSPVSMMTSLASSLSKLLPLSLSSSLLSVSSSSPSSSSMSRVVLPSGRTYLSGTIFLRPRTVLHIEVGATLLASAEQSRYPLESLRWYLVLAEGAADVGITGGGVIQGPGAGLIAKVDPMKNVMVSWNKTGDCRSKDCRPKLIGFHDCKGVRVWNISLEDPGHWCLHLARSSDILIHDVSIHGNFATPNTDGIDIEDSNNIDITRCQIDTGDDGIVPKTFIAPVYNLTVSHCSIRTKSSAIKLGSESHSNFYKLHFDNIDILDSHRGLGIQLRDSGNISQVTFSNIRVNTRYYDPSWWGNAEPIYVTSCPRTSSTVVGSISNISFLNISAFSENGIFLSGSDSGLVQDLYFANVRVELKRWTEESGSLADYRPGCQGLVERMNSGVFIEHANNLRMHNVTLVWIGPTNFSVLPLDFAPSSFGRLELSNFKSFVVEK